MRETVWYFFLFHCLIHVSMIGKRKCSEGKNKRIGQKQIDQLSANFFRPGRRGGGDAVGTRCAKQLCNFILATSLTSVMIRFL